MTFNTFSDILSILFLKGHACTADCELTNYNKELGLTSTVCVSVAFSLNFTLSFSLFELCLTLHVYCVTLLAEIGPNCTCKTCTAGLFPWGDGGGAGAGRDGSPVPLIVLPGTARGTGGQLDRSIGTTSVLRVMEAAARAVLLTSWGLMVVSSIACGIAAW